MYFINNVKHAVKARFSAERTLQLPFSKLPSHVFVNIKVSLKTRSYPSRRS